MAHLGTRSLKVKVGATEQTSSVSKCAVTSAKADSDFTSYADAAAGGALDWFLEFTAAQDMATGSLWRYLWDNPGTTVAIKVNPYGNATATATEPHYSGNVTVKVPEGVVIGGDANASTTAKQTFEAKWQWTAKPTELVTGAF